MGPAEWFVLCLCASVGWHCGALTSSSQKFNALWGLAGDPLLSVCGELSDLLGDLSTGLNSPGGTVKVEVAVASEGTHTSPPSTFKQSWVVLWLSKFLTDFRWQNTVGLSQKSIFRLTEPSNKVSEDFVVYVGVSLLQLLLIFSQRRAERSKREESKKIETEFSRGFQVMADISLFNS